MNGVNEYERFVMHDLTELINRWENSALNFREAETLVNLLIVDNRRIEKECNGWRDVVQQCEKIAGCHDTADRPLMSNLPNILRDAILFDCADDDCECPDGVPDMKVTATGYLADFGGLYWSVFGERGLTIDSFTHWMPIPGDS